MNLVRDEKDTGKSRGFCFLKYEDARSCVLSVDNLNGSKILGRSIRVDHVENYRLPKNLREKQKEEEEGGSSCSNNNNNTLQYDESKHLKVGHAYDNKELANSFDIYHGQDLFAVAEHAVSSTKLTNAAGEVDGSSKEERREAKRKRKEARDEKRRVKAASKERREERRREKRARKLKSKEISF